MKLYLYRLGDWLSVLLDWKRVSSRRKKLTKQQKTTFLFWFSSSIQYIKILQQYAWAISIASSLSLPTFGPHCCHCMFAKGGQNDHRLPSTSISTLDTTCRRQCMLTFKKKGRIVRLMLTTSDLWNSRGRGHDLWFQFFEKVRLSMCRLRMTIYWTLPSASTK